MRNGKQKINFGAPKNISTITRKQNEIQNQEYQKQLRNYSNCASIQQQDKYLQEIEIRKNLNIQSNVSSTPKSTKENMNLLNQSSNKQSERMSTSQKLEQSKCLTAGQQTNGILDQKNAQKNKAQNKPKKIMTEPSEILKKKHEKPQEDYECQYIQKKRSYSYNILEKEHTKQKLNEQINQISQQLKQNQKQSAQVYKYNAQQDGQANSKNEENNQKKQLFFQNQSKVQNEKKNLRYQFPFSRQSECTTPTKQQNKNIIKTYQNAFQQIFDKFDKMFIEQNKIKNQEIQQFQNVYKNRSVSAKKSKQQDGLFIQKKEENNFQVKLNFAQTAKELNHIKTWQFEQEENQQSSNLSSNSISTKQQDGQFNQFISNKQSIQQQKNQIKNQWSEIISINQLKENNEQDMKQSQKQNFKPPLSQKNMISNNNSGQQDPQIFANITNQNEQQNIIVIEQNEELKKEKEMEKKEYISNLLCEKNFEVSNLNGGSGSFGVVMYVKDKSDNQYFAIKVQNIFDSDLLKIDREKLESCENETQHLRDMNHKNVVKFYDAFVIKNYHFIKMELCECSLEQWVEKNKHKPLSSIQFIHFANQLLDGIEYVHNRNIVLRDLALKNILICSDGTIKLCDFGLVKKFNPQYADQMLITSQQKGTMYYYPPEIMNNQNKQFIYTQKGDIWQLGICLQVLGGLESDQSYLWTKSVSKASNINLKCNQLIEFILIEDPNKRPTIPMIRQFIYQNIITDILQSL